MVVHMGRKVFGRELHELLRIGRIRGHHRRAQQFTGFRIRLQRQDGQGAVIAKAFMGLAFMRHGVAEAADDDAAAKVRHLRTHAQHAAHAGKTAICRNHQRRFERCTIHAHAVVVLGVMNFSMGRRDRHLGHACAGDDVHAFGGAGHFPGRAAQGMVGHDAAQIVCATAVRDDVQRGTQAYGAVMHDGITDGANLMVLQPAPGAQTLQDLHAGMGQRDLAPIGCGLGQLGFALQFQHRGLQARLGQRNGKRQAGRTCAHNKDIGVHGHVCNHCESRAYCGLIYGPRCLCGPCIVGRFGLAVACIASMACP